MAPASLSEVLLKFKIVIIKMRYTPKNNIVELKDYESRWK